MITHARHAYGSVLRVSSKKKLPEMITFKFGYTTDDGECKVVLILLEYETLKLIHLFLKNLLRGDNCFAF